MDPDQKSEMLRHAKDECQFVLDAAKAGRLMRIVAERHPIEMPEAVQIDPDHPRVKPGLVMVVSFMVRAK